jgi:DNA-binding NarL/FixJ family response regulator
MASQLRPEPAPLRVLIVDDHPMVREGLRSMLEPAGIEVVGEAGTGADALRLAAATAPDVILLDLELPDLDGVAVLQRLRTLERVATVLVITMHDDQALVRRAVENGASGYVLKGISRRALLSALATVRHGGSVVDPLLLRAALSSPVTQSTETTAAVALTSVERDMLRLVAQGLTNREIGTKLHWSVGTVKKHLQRTLDKLGAADRTQAAVEAVRRGLLS